MDEQWRDVPDFEGLYQVSDLGRVKSLARTARVQGDSCRRVAERILTPNKTRGEYLSICLCKNGKKTTLPIHRLVAQSFLANPEDKRTVNHINGDKKDNRATNLEWNTYSENISHAYKSLGRKPTKYWLGKGGPGSHFCKKIYQSDMNGNVLNKFNSITEAAASVNLSLSTISSALTGKNKTAGGFKWIYADCH